MKKILSFLLLFFTIIMLCSFNNKSIEEINKKNYPTFLINNSLHKAIVDPIFLVNRNFYLDEKYIPDELEIIVIDYIKRDEVTLIKKEVNDALINLQKELKTIITVFSAYRSYEKQATLYLNNSDNLTAKPGHSEHQTGYAVDISSRDIGLTYELEHSLLYKELNEISYKHGFILRYPKGKEEITKYPFEPWHYRYVGKKIATIIYNENLTLEEYFFKYVSLSY